MRRLDELGDDHEDEGLKSEKGQERNALRAVGEIQGSFIEGAGGGEIVKGVGDEQRQSDPDRGKEEGDSCVDLNGIEMEGFSNSIFYIEMKRGYFSGRMETDVVRCGDSLRNMCFSKGDGVSAVALVEDRRRNEICFPGLEARRFAGRADREKNVVDCLRLGNRDLNVGSVITGDGICVVFM